jgi:transcriptional regulator NrdR family protein
MKCPSCSSTGKMHVIDGRPRGDCYWRRRRCSKCEYRWSTYERPILDTEEAVIKMRSMKAIYVDVMDDMNKIMMDGYKRVFDEKY